MYILQSLSETQTMNKCARVRKNSQKQLLNPSEFCATCKIVDRAGPGVALMQQHTHQVETKVWVVVLLMRRILGDAKEEEEWVSAPAPPSSPPSCARENVEVRMRRSIDRRAPSQPQLGRPHRHGSCRRATPAPPGRTEQLGFKPHVACQQLIDNYGAEWLEIE